MKKIILPLFLFSFLLCPVLVFAQEPPEAPVYVETINDVIAIVERGANWLLGLVVVIAVVMIMYAGLKWMTAGGEEEKMSEARRVLTWALTGVGVALLARGLVEVIDQLVAIR